MSIQFHRLIFYVFLFGPMPAYSLSFFVCDKQEEKAEQRIKQVFSKCQPLDQFGRDRLLVGFGFPTFWV